MDNLHQHSYHSILTHLDRGLQSAALADVLAVVRSCPGYVKDMPFPLFVNSVLLRLVDIFQGEKFNPRLEEFLNVVRLNIIKAVKEFRRHLEVAFSCDEIIRCVMKVSHSNDYHARSLTLLFIAALAPLIHENKKAHHLLIESMDCNKETELLASIFAATEFSRYSLEFCELVVEKMGELLCANQIPAEVKLRLLGMLANFKESYAVACICFQLTTRLLHADFSQQLRVAVFDASTQLATRSCLLVGEQIALLLSELDLAITHINGSSVLCILRNLAHLAEYSQHWKLAQIANLCDMFERIKQLNSKKAVCAWLECIEVLTATGIHCQFIVEKDLSWMSLLRSDYLPIRVAGLQLLMNVMDSGTHLRGVFLTTVASSISDFQQIIFATNKNSVFQNFNLLETLKLFYSSIINFARMSHCTAENAYFILLELTRNCDVVKALSEKNFYTFACVNLRLITQTICVICLAHSARCASFAANWAYRQFLAFVNKGNINADQQSNLPFSLFNIILMAQQLDPIALTLNAENDSTMIVEAFNSSEDPTSSFNNFLSTFDIFSQQCQKITRSNDSILELNDDGWTRYKIARCALHYGHWRNVALPLLESIRSSCDSLETSLWIDGLIYIAKSNFADELSVGVLNNTYGNLRNAYLIFQRLIAVPRRDNERCFIFAAAYINCMALTWQAVSGMLSILNVKQLMLVQISQTNDERSQQPDLFRLEQLGNSFGSLRSKLTAVHSAWVQLFQRSFDADSHTLEHLHLWAQLIVLLENLLLFLSSEPLKPMPRSLAGNFNAGSIGSIRCFTKIRDLYNIADGRFEELLYSFKAILDALVAENSANDSMDEGSSLNTPRDLMPLREALLPLRLTTRNFNIIKEILLSLKNFPFTLPRFFFQRIFHTKIKLNISQMGRDQDGTINITTPLLPFAVEGVVLSDNTKRIDTIIVRTEMSEISSTNTASSRSTTPAIKKPFVEERVISLEKETNYFKAQFLLKFTQALTKVNVRVLFTDAATKRTWLDDEAIPDFSVQYHEISKAVVQYS